nr:integrase, catalytic region, zinc finger, CCHC-type, peptidase aspartic, catalytic [Tanacetum cinerariifolium]
MANLSEDIQCAGSDTRPPMLDRTDFASWQQRIRLYCRGKENGVNILKSIDEGPYQMGTVWETLAEGTEGAPHLGLERPRVYSDLSSEEKDRYNADIHATNILLQGLPKDIYTLINHYTDAKDIWDNVKMLLEGSELTKEDRESQLYDDFEHFRQHKGESIHDYYVWFAKLINDIRNIKMTMSRMQLNSKFVNNMLPEWGRFVTAVKLNRGLRDSNYDQLGQEMNPQGGGAAGYRGVQNRVGNVNLGQARPVKCYNCNGAWHIARNCTQPKRPQNSEYYKDKMLLMQVQENRVALDMEQLLFLAGGQDNAFDDDVDEQPVQDLALNVDNVFQADDCDAFDSDVDEAPTAQTMFMANLSFADPVTDEAGPSYDSNILSENEVNKVAIGYKNPLCLTRAKQVQPALYNGHEIIKDNHVPTIVHNTDDTLEIAEITRKKINDKMKEPECMTRKVKIASHDYLKKNFLATFTPQKQLTPEQIFWSQDLIKLKPEAVKEQTTVFRPIKALTVYPPNTPATLVPRVLPIKSQVKIHIFTLIQLFSKFDKTCKKRITPTGLTEGERGFEQTKECYLKEVIPFFKTLKDNFEGIQKALTNEIKEMKDVFEELEAEVVQIVLWYLDSGCSKHMTGDRSRLMNFVKKFIGTVRFGNDHFGAIMGYGDYVIGDNVISKNGVVERQNRTLVEAARAMLIFSKASMFLWAEAVATPCYTQNRSLIHTRYHKTPYELVHNKKPDLTFFRVFGALCYPTNDSKDLGKLQPTADIGIFVGYAPSRKGTGPAPNLLMHGQTSSGLVPNPVPATHYVTPTNKDLEILFQPMFDEYLKPSRVERPVHPAQAVQAPVNSAGTPSSTTIDQDAPSPSILPSSSTLQSHSLHQGVTVESTYMEDHPVAPIDNNPFVNVFASEPYSENHSGILV